MNDAYITGTGAYLPGDPVDNDELRARGGVLPPPDARLRDRTLAANGIRTRHYAVDGGGQTLMLNEELAVHAISRALADRGLGPEAVRMLRNDPG
jgi:3-oxoacyl-[acyl-carrier-protein] synthase-3